MDEHQLILSAQRGEKKALQSLIAMYYPYVSNFLLKLCGDETVSQDLTQDTFLKLIQRIDQFDIHGKAAFSTYVMAIAKNCYIDYWRHSKKTMLCLEEESILDDSDLQEKVLDRMQAEEVLKILDRFPPEQAAAIRLKYLEQQTLQEIALRFGCEPKTVKSRIHNGMVKLREILKGGSL